MSSQHNPVHTVDNTAAVAIVGRDRRCSFSALLEVASEEMSALPSATSTETLAVHQNHNQPQQQQFSSSPDVPSLNLSREQSASPPIIAAHPPVSAQSVRLPSISQILHPTQPVGVEYRINNSGMSSYPSPPMHSTPTIGVTHMQHQQQQAPLPTLRDLSPFNRRYSQIQPQPQLQLQNQRQPVLNIRTANTIDYNGNNILKVQPRAQQQQQFQQYSQSHHQQHQLQAPAPQYASYQPQSSSSISTPIQQQQHQHMQSHHQHQHQQQQQPSQYFPPEQQPQHQHQAHHRQGYSFRKNGTWTTEEDELLKAAVQQFGMRWARVAKLVPGRSNVQCRNRWKDVLDPSITSRSWSVEEDQRLLALHKEHGNQWALISSKMNGRTALRCRDRYVRNLRIGLYNGEPN